MQNISWLPMETAPLDGRKVVLLCEVTHHYLNNILPPKIEKYPLIGRWMEIDFGGLMGVKYCWYLDQSVVDSLVVDVIENPLGWYPIPKIL